MKKALRLSALAFVCIFVLIVLSALVSCTQDPMASIKKTPTIRGNVTIPSGANVKGSDFYIRIMEGENAVYTGKVKDDGSFAVEGLDETKTYSILLSTEELGEINTSTRDVEVSRDIARATTTSGYGGWLKNVTASVNEQAGVGSIKVKPLGTIKGVAKRSGEEEHSDIMVYIPGTSYMAVTDASGNYSIFNVPQSSSTYNLRCISLTGDWLPEVITGVLLYSDSDTENPVKTVPAKSIVKNAGNLLGTIIKTAATDNSNITVLIQNDEYSETGTTASDGSLRITGILPGTYKVTISATGFVTQTIDNVVIKAAKDTSIGERTLVANGGDIIGSISVNDGSPRTGALVTATSQDKKYVYTTQTSTDGSFVIPNAFATTYDIIVTKTGYADTIRNGVRVAAGQNMVLGAIELSSSFGTVSGRVLDSKGNALANAIVKVGDISILTDEDGSFSKTGIAVGNYVVTVSKDGFSTYTMPQTVTVESSYETRLGTFRLSSIYGSISGKVTVNDGGSTANIDVTATASDGTKTQVKTTGDGSYAISNLLPGSYNVTASADGYVSAERSISVTADTNTLVDGLALKLSSGSLKVSVEYADKPDTAGITVKLSDSSGNTVSEIITTNNLTVSFTGIQVGTYTITAEAEGYASSVKAGVSVISALETYVYMPALANRYGTVSGTIKDTKGIAIENAIVKIGEISVFTGKDGTFSKTGIPVGNHSVSISKEGYSSQILAQTITVESSMTTNIGTIQLVSIYGSISGSVAVNDGKSVANIDVSATSSDGTRIQAKTIENGSYTIQGLTPGSYTVTASSEDYSDAYRSVSVTADRNTEVDLLTLNSKYGTLTGRVIDSDGNPLSGVAIMIGNLDAITTKTDGTFSKDRVPVGTYSLSITKEGFVDEYLDDVEVRSFIATELENDIVLTPRTGTITGKIRIEGESDLSGIKVTVTSSGSGREYSSYTESDGTFSISAVAGNYNQVEFSHPCCHAQYYLDKVALFANGTVEIKPYGSNSSEYQLSINHNYGIIYNESKASTCTEQGYNMLRCWGCGKEVTEYLDLLEHDNVLVGHLDPTCTEDGWRKYECSLCGQSFTEIDAASGHDWGTPVLLEASTCHAAGSQKLTCKTCGAEEIQTIEKLPHTWVDNGYHDGKIEYKCSICNETEYADDSTAILNVSDWGSVSLKPSVDPNSVKTLIIPSEIDGMTVTSVFNHTFQDCVNITKIVLPNTLTTIEDWAFAGCIGVTEIELPASLERIGEHAFRGCTSLKSIEIPAGLNEINHYAFYGCSSLASVTLPETITMLGRECFAGCSFDRIHIPDSVENIVCYAFCDNTNLKEVLIPRSVKYMDDRPFMGCWNLETVYIQSETQPSGWVSTWNDTSARIVWGYTGELHYAHTESTEWNISSTYHWHECTQCGEVMSMAKHEYADEVTKQPTCTETGIRTYTCTVCGQNYTEEVPALGHDYHSEVTVQATCTEKGELTYTCSRCDSSYTEEVVSHHEYTEQITAAATCTTDGLKTLTCSICGDTKTEVIPAIGHSYKETVVPATCTEAGTKIHKCEHCSDTYEEVIPATGHNYVASITKQANCEEDGIKTFVCSGCSDTYTETIPAYGHYFTSSTIVQPATCYEAGIKSSKCFRCGKSVTEEIPKLNHVPVAASDDANHWTQCSLCGEILVPKVTHTFVETEGDFVCSDCGYSDSSLYYQVDSNGVLTPKDKSILPAVVRIPSNIEGKAVKSIGEQAFLGCTGITSLIIPNGIEVIGKDAFSGCSSLSSVSLPDGLKEIGVGVFWECVNLKYISLPDSLTTLGGLAFYGSGLLSIEIPCNVNSVGYNVFGDSSLQTLILPATINRVYEGLTQVCPITSIIFGGTMDEWYQLEKDSRWRFGTPVTTVTCSDGTIELGNYEVDSEGNFYVVDKSKIGSVFEVPATVDGKTVTGLGNSCFWECSELEELTIPNTVTFIDYYCFLGCHKLRVINGFENIKRSTYSYFNDTLIETLDFSNMYYWEGGLPKHIKTLTISNKLEELPSMAGCEELEEIVFLGTVAEWNRYEKINGWHRGVPATYVECSDGNVDITLVFSIKADGTLSCYDSSELPANYEIPSEVNGITVKALDNNFLLDSNNFESIVVPEGVTKIGENSFGWCHNLRDITIPSTVTELGAAAFKACDKMESIVIPGGIKRIENQLFSECHNLRYIYFMGTVEKWNSLSKDWEWDYGVPAEYVVCLDGKAYIKETDVFSVSQDGIFTVNDKSKIPANFEVPASINGVIVTKIGDSAFEYCDSLVTLTLPSTVTTIGRMSISHCNNLREIIGSEYIKQMEGGFSLDWNDSLEALYLPNCESWHSNGDGFSIRTLTISNKLSEMPNLGRCDNLEEIIFLGTIAQWKKMPKDNLWRRGISVTTVQCNDGVYNLADETYFITNDGVLYYYDFTSLPSNYEIPSFVDGIRVKELASKCFSGWNQLMSVEIPAGLTKIADGAFEYCSSLSDVTIPDTVTEIGFGAFYFCSSLKNIIIPSSVTKIDWIAFEGSGVVSIIIPDSVNELGDAAINNCKSLESVVISKNIKEIPQALFKGCTKLSSITYNGTVEEWNSLPKGDEWNTDVPATKVVCSNGEILFPTTNYTIEFWYMYQGGHGEGDFHIYVSPELRFWVGYNIHLQTNSWEESGPVMPDGGDRKWHYIAITGNTSGTIVYVDGEETVNTSFVKSSSPEAITIENQKSLIERFSISDVARSASEIAQYYQYSLENDPLSTDSQVVQRGPAGGYIIYDCDADNASGNADGLISTECGWRYLEASPDELDFYWVELGYHRNSYNGANLFVNGTETYNASNCTGTAIGTGQRNTQLLLTAMGEAAYAYESGSDKESNYAAKLCDNLEYTHDGVVYDDWFLPSKDELNLMYNILYVNGIGGFQEWEYWSSSEYPGDARLGWEQWFPTGEQWLQVSRADFDRVRPIRAFL